MYCVAKAAPSDVRPFRMLLHSCVFALLLVLGATSSSAQDATLRGFVTDASSGASMQGVNVVLRGLENDAFYGAATSKDGIYAISGITPGRYRLEASYISYAVYEDTLTLSADELREYNVSLAPAGEELDEIVVESERETVGAAAVSAGLQTIRPTEIELVPTPDVSADLVSYLTTVPGVVSTGDRGGQLFIRGGEPTQNLVTIDGMTLYQPFHIVGFYSAFPAYIVNSVDLYAGGFGARYGGRLSSVLDISARAGNMRRFGGAVSLAPFVSGIRLEGPLWRDNISFLASWRQSVIEEGASRIIDQPLPYNFSDQFAKIQANVTANSRLSVTGIRTRDKGSLVAQVDRPDDVASRGENVEWRNEAIGGRYLLLPATIPVFADVTLSYSHFENLFGESDDPNRSSEVSEYKAAVNVTHFLDVMDFGWGLFLHTYDLQSDLGGRYQNVTTDREFITEAGAYLQPELNLGDFQINPSVRIQTFPSKSRTFVEPRLRMMWNVTPAHRISAAAGIYHQEVVGLTDRRDAGNVFTAWTASPLNRVPRAIHAILGYRIQPMQDLSFSVEGYYKKLSNLFVSEWTALPQFTTELQVAEGQVYGFDLRAELRQSLFYGFISYGYSNTLYEAAGENIIYWYGEQSKEYHPPHDRRHQINALASVDLWDFQFSLRWQFGAGLPFTQAAGFDEFVLVDGPTNPTEEPGNTRVIYAEPYQGRLPDYHRIDISLERTFEFSEHVRATVAANVINGYDRENLFYLDLYTLQRVNQLPLVPSLGLKIAFD